MSEKIILNPERSGWSTDIQDNMNPNYGFTRKRPITRLSKKAVGGVPYTRELQNTGHSFTFSWIGRSFACVQRLKWFAEQFEDGFFTIIDWDGGGRHYVGHFTSEISPVPTSNGKWDVQGATFEEIPTVPMLEYPSDWDRDAIALNPFNDYGDQKLATSGAWTAAAHTVTDDDTGLVSSYTTMDDPGTSTDWAQHEYRGYGFRLWLRKGPAFGQCNVLLDGTLVQMVDCYAAANSGPAMVLLKENVPLDYHRVQVVCLGTKDGASSATNISWARLEVMR